jgi:outer membrane protein TolC
MSRRLLRFATSVLCVLCFRIGVHAQAPDNPQPTLALTLEDAVARGLRENIAARLGESDVVSARGDRWVALRDLLPTATARIGFTRQEINLAAFGFSLPGFPTLVGPYNLHDARLYVSQPIVDLHALYASRSGAANLRAAELDIQDTRAVISLAMRNLYLQAVTGESRMNAVRAQAETARALFNQATDLRNAGVVAGIDVLRAQVQMRTQDQRVIAAQNEYDKSKLQLARAIGLPQGQPFTLADAIPYAPIQGLSLEDALKQASTSRDDLKAAEARSQAADALRRAALADNLPSLHVSADYGEIGRTPADTHSTYMVLTQVRIPLFEAATTRGHILQAEGLVQRRRAELEDLRTRVEYDVRAAFLDLRSADQLLQSAQEAVNLANQQLAQTRDRFAAGVAGNIEVVQAQEAVATATDNYIASLYAHNVAKASLARAIGGGI